MPPLFQDMAVCTDSSCVRSAMLHASETWPLTNPNLQRLQRNDRAMIRQTCNVRPQDVITRSNELLARLGIEDLDLILKERRLRWYGHMERSNGAVKQPFTYRLRESVGLGGPRWHGSSWQRGIAESGSSRLSTLMTEICGDLVWDLPCVQQASYLEGGQLMWMLPLYLHVNQKSDYDDIWYYTVTHYSPQQMVHQSTLTLVLLKPDIPCLCKQCRSRSVGFWRSQMIWICTVCHSVCEFIATIRIKESDWLTIRSRHGMTWVNK